MQTPNGVFWYTQGTGPRRVCKEELMRYSEIKKNEFND